MAKKTAKKVEAEETQEEVHIGPVTLDYEDGFLIAKVEVKSFAIKLIDKIPGTYGAVIGAGLKKALGI